MYLRHLYGNDCGDAFKGIVSREVLLIFLEDLRSTTVCVDGARESSLEASHVRAVLRVIDIVRKGEKTGCKVVHILKRYLNSYAVLLTVDIEDVLVDGVLVLVVEGYE